MFHWVLDASIQPLDFQHFANNQSALKNIFSLILQLHKEASDTEDGTDTKL